MRFAQELYHWLLNDYLGMVLELPSKDILMWLFAAAFVTWLINFVISLRFFFLPFFEEEKSLKEKSGDSEKISFFGKIHLVFAGIILMPFIEETLFRSLVVYFSRHENYIAAFLSVIFGALVFGLAHRFDKIARPWLICSSMVIHSLMYGLSAMITGSLWTSIFAHSFWNLSLIIFCVMDESGDRLINLAKSVQPGDSQRG